jgi:hypothetical protein
MAMDLNSFDAIMVLAEPEQSGANDDAATVLTLLLLSDIFGNGQRPKIICEINNESNHDLIIPDLADDLIVSSEVISVQLARISEEPLLGAINKELFSAGGIELALRTLGEYGISREHVSYGELQAAAQANHETAVGTLKSNAAEPVTMYPLPDTRYSRNDEFQLIVLAHQVFS